MQVSFYHREPGRSLARGLRRLLRTADHHPVSFFACVLQHTLSI